MKLGFLPPQVWWLLAIAEMGAIWWLSSLTQPVGDLTLFPHADKLIHFSEFGLLAFLWFQGFKIYGLQRAVKLAALIPIIWGVLDEFHQSFVPGREPDFLDLICNVAGVVFSLIICWRYEINKR